MKNKLVIALAIIFLLLVNTRYYWEWPDESAVIQIVGMVIYFFLLTILFFIQLGLAFREQWKNRNKYYNLAIIGAVLVTTILFPTGLIDFEKYEMIDAPQDVFIAEGKGAAYRYITLKLKERKLFSVESHFFGKHKNEGTYSVAGDTVYFNSIGESGADTAAKFKFKFGVIKPSTKEQKGTISLYAKEGDVVPVILYITENNLTKQP